VVKNDRGRIVGSHSVWTAIVDVDSSTMAASGGGRPVAEDEQRPAVALRLVGDHRDEPVQPPQRLTARGPLDVDALVVQQRAHPDGSQRRLGPQPPVTFGLVRHDHLFRDAVDLAEAPLAQAGDGGADHQGVLGLPQGLVQAPAEELRMAEAAARQLVDGARAATASASAS
jgi:hypothetical protein